MMVMMMRIIIMIRLIITMMLTKVEMISMNVIIVGAIDHES